MMTNEQMKPGRFKAQFEAKKLYNRIIERLADPNGFVQVSTCTRSTVYYSKHASMFSHDRTAVYVQSGKKKIHIYSFHGAKCNIRFGKEI